MVKKETEDEIFTESRIEIIKPYYEYNINILSKELSEKN